MVERSSNFAASAWKSKMFDRATAFAIGFLLVAVAAGGAGLYQERLEEGWRRPPVLHGKPAPTDVPQRRPPLRQG